MKKIVFAGGGTLGHIYPMIPVIEELKKIYPEIEIIFIGSKKGLENKVLRDNTNITESYFLDIQGFKRRLSMNNFKTVYKYYKSINYCKTLLRKLSPDIVIGMGGYVSGPVVKSASKLKIKTIIHEQNSVMGLANKVLLKKVDLVLLSYNIPLKNKNYLLVGNPRSSQVYRLSQNYSKGSSVYPKVVVVGGSRGAGRINDCILSIGPELKRKKIKTTLITGEKYYEENKEKVKKHTNEFLEVIPFSNSIIKLFIDADLVISRSGATTISELMALEKITLFIPSPNVTSNHQYKNAKILEDEMAAKVLLEENLNSYTLIEEIESLLFNDKLRERMKKGIKNFRYLDATQRFIQAIVELSKR